MLDVVECDDIKHGSATMYALFPGADEEGEGTSISILLFVGVHQVLMRCTDYPRLPTMHTDFLAGEELKSRRKQ
jgi:hypothetical protein